MLGLIFDISGSLSNFKHQKSCAFVLSGEDINGFFVLFYSFIEILIDSIRIKGERYSLALNTVLRDYPFTDQVYHRLQCRQVAVSVCLLISLECVTQSYTSTLTLYVAIIFLPAGNCNSLIPAECRKPRL